MNIKELFNSFCEDDFYSKINLHIHSNHSDGENDFDELIEQAKNLGMKYISITDHNTISGYKNSKYINDEILIQGVEFDCFYKMSLLHILGYGIDINNEKLNALCAKNQQEQKNDLIRLFKSILLLFYHPISTLCGTYMFNYILQFLYITMNSAFIYIKLFSHFIHCNARILSNQSNNTLLSFMFLRNNFF